LRQAAADRPDAFLKEYAEPFGCTAAAVFRALEKLDITRKKKPFTYCEKSEERRAEYTARIKRVPRNKRVYADESGVNTCLPHEYARAPRGERAGDLKRGRRFERVNVTGALCAGAHWAVECCRRAASGEFLGRRFTGCLPAAILKGYRVIVDSAPFRRKKRLRKLAGGKVRLLFLPPYSPDYNPIEKPWANMKRFLRNNQRDFQSVNSAVYDYFGVP
jgi:transposase